MAMGAVAMAVPILWRCVGARVAMVQEHLQGAEVVGKTRLKCVNL